jgi:hypothetical protein
MDPAWEDDKWASESDRNVADEIARRKWRRDVMKQPVTSRSFTSALLILLGTAGLSLFLGIESLSRRGPEPKIGAGFLFLWSAYVLFVFIRGAIRTIRTGSPPGKP